MTASNDNQLKTPQQLAWSIALGGSGIVLTAALLVLTWYAATTLFLIFAGILFGVFLTALSDLLRRLIGGGPSLRLVIVCVFLVALFGGFMVLSGNTVAQQATALSSTIRAQVVNVKGFLDRHGVDTNIFGLGSDATATADAGGSGAPASPNLPSAGAIASGTGAILTQTLKLLSGVFGTVGNIFVVLLLGILLAAQPQLYRDGLLSFIPQRHRASARQLADEVSETLRRWLIGQLATMSTLFVVTWVGLAIIGVPGALVLGFVTGLLSFIPTVGALVAGAVIVLASLGSSWTVVASAFGLYLFVQFLEGNILTPLIQRHAIDIPPATLFAAQILLGVLFGLWGLALALPLIAVAKVVINHFQPDDAAVPATR